MTDYSKIYSDDFPEEFYNFVYGSVHHHSYANDRANYLIERFGKVRFLDIGCACGILVKTLRERGAEAWGIEISEYALSQSCAPDSTKRGDIRSIPFPDGFFDVAHSQGVMGYFPESDVEKAISECKRVGKYQFHNIDTNITIPAYGYKFMRPIEFWRDIFPGGLG